MGEGRVTDSARDRVRSGVVQGVLLGLASYVSFLLATQLISRVHSISATDDQVGGMWAVIATIFVFRGSYAKSFAAGVSRLAGTLVSFAICLVYLSLLPYYTWALALLIGISALVMIILGRPDDAATAAVTTAVLIALAKVTPQHAWQEPILRLADTVIGIVVGVAFGWLVRAGRTPGHSGKPEE
jgi:uncharacterized membrane protein YccC